MRVNPTLRLALRPFGTINAPYRTVPALQAPPASQRPWRRSAGAALTATSEPASTTDSRGPPWPCSVWSERRRSRYLPFKLRSRTGAAVVHRDVGPEDSFVEHVPLTIASAIAGRSLKRVKAVDPPTGTRCRVPDPAIT